jgi:glycolate dehydrogenase iron-sulfur subunit
MYSRPAQALAGSPLAEEARDLIRSCVHCGFCLPACPTYRVTGSELDSPRGRIYLVKEMLEHGAANETTRAHLDRCLTCRACEPACPSGVQYGRLADLGRELVESQPPAPRAARERLLRSLLLAVATRRSLFTPLVRVGQVLRPLLPARLKSLLPPPARRGGAAKIAWPAPRHARRMAVLEGCVQPGLAPQVNAAAARVLDRLGVSLVAAREVGCCGAMEHHLGRPHAALRNVERNVRAGVRLLDAGVEAIVSTASGCGVFAKDYGHVLRHASDATRAAGVRVGAATRDLCEVVDPCVLASVRARASTAAGRGMRVAWQAPCSLQYGQRATTAGRVEALLRAVGCELVPVRDPTLCCGSAGTYSLLQPELSQELRRRKLAGLVAAAPDVIATANVGCLEHLRQASPVPVRHWIEVVDEALAGGR